MLREKPEVAFGISHAVLALAVDGFVQLFYDGCAMLAGAGVVRVKIRDKNREALGSIAELDRSMNARRGELEHKTGFAAGHLDAADWIAIAIKLAESTGTDKPGASSFKVAVADVRQQGENGDRTVLRGNRVAAGC